jgi:hypothetical protein
MKMERSEVIAKGRVLLAKSKELTEKYWKLQREEKDTAKVQAALTKLHNQMDDFEVDHECVLDNGSGLVVFDSEESQQEETDLRAEPQRVQRESQGNIVIVAVVYGWKGDKRLKPRTVKGFFKVNEDTHHDIACGGYWLNKLVDVVAGEFIEAGKAKGQDWSVSEAWSR